MFKVFDTTILTPNKDYRHYIAVEGHVGPATWRHPAEALGLVNVYEYVKYLKDNYDVIINFNPGPKPFSKWQLQINFKYKEQAEQLANLCNERVFN